MCDSVKQMMDRVNGQRLARDVFYLAADPLPFRKLNYTVPGHEKCTLYEADDFICAELEAAGWALQKEAVQVQAFRCDASKPKAHQYSAPEPDDPWYTAYNIYAKRTGTTHPDEIVILVAHKDSQSWVDSPGAYDNAVGTASNLEIARVLSGYEPRRSIWLLFCNEEHTPWTSVTAAEGCRERGDNVIAVLNQDGLGARSQADIDADRKVHTTRYTVEEGRWLADLMSEVIRDYGIGLIQTVSQREFANDDDGSFVKAGFPAAVHNGGSGAAGYPDYHRETDTPDKVDVETIRMATQAALAAVLRIDAAGD